MHNLKTNQLENLKRFEKILGYNSNKLSVSFINSKIHPNDLNVIVEAYHTANKYINDNELFDPTSCQLTLLYRLLRADNKYIHVQSQTTVCEVLNNKIYKTFSLCNDVTELNLKCNCAVYFKAPGFSVHDNIDIVNKNKRCLNQLSLMEKNIVMLLSAGYNTNSISEKLNLSLNTIYTHRRNIFKKTGLKNMVEIINEYN